MSLKRNLETSKQSAPKRRIECYALESQSSYSGTYLGAMIPDTFELLKPLISHDVCQYPGCNNPRLPRSELCPASDNGGRLCCESCSLTWRGSIQWSGRLQSIPEKARVIITQMIRKGACERCKRSMQFSKFNTPARFRCSSCYTYCTQCKKLCTDPVAEQFYVVARGFDGESSDANWRRESLCSKCLGQKTCGDQDLPDPRCLVCSQKVPWRSDANVITEQIDQHHNSKVDYWGSGYVHEDCVLTCTCCRRLVAQKNNLSGEVDALANRCDFCAHRCHSCGVIMDDDGTIKIRHGEPYCKTCYF